MEKPNLTLNEYLRYFLAGAIVLICYFFLNPDTFEKLDIKNNAPASIPLVLAPFVFGALIYSVHRAIFYPFFYWLMLLCFCKNMINEDFRRWKQRREDSFSKDLGEWGSQVHFLYCSALAVLLVIVITKFIMGSCMPCWPWIAYGILFLGAVIHHYRYLRYDLRTKKKDAELSPKKTLTKNPDRSGF